jgi:CheY-like chemotaxis protein
LKSGGLSCVFASDGAEAWTLLRVQELPTLALLDWVLPKLERQFPSITLSRDSSTWIKVPRRQDGIHNQILAANVSVSKINLRKLLQSE